MKLVHRYLPHLIFASLLLGILVGYWMPQTAPYVAFLGSIFKLSLGMMVMPIVFCSILGGMGTMGNVRQLGKIGLSTLAYFTLTTFIAIFIGLLLVNFIHPGQSALLSLPVQPHDTVSLGSFFQQQIEKSLVNPFEALSTKNVLASILFAMLLGGALASSRTRSQPVFQIVEIINEALQKIVHIIISFAPIGVFGLVVDVTASTGLSVFQNLGLYALCVLLGLAIMLFGVLPGLVWLKTSLSPLVFLRALRPVIAVAFSTSSSNATLPVNIQCTEEELKVAPEVARFVLPLGATINMNGTALYEAVAAVFIAQLCGVAVDLPSSIIIALTAALAAVGAAGIPAAGTVTMALVLSAAHLPLEGIGLLLAIDRPLDMCRTVINVVGDSACALIVHSSQHPLKH